LRLPAILTLTALVAIPAWVDLAAQEAGKNSLRIAVVDMNAALNNSESGKRSKKILMADKDQMEDALKAQEADLKQKAEELKANLLLNEQARTAREGDLRELDRKLRESVQKAQKELQDKERRYTETIFSEIKTVVGLVAREEKFDLVLERSASAVILFSEFQMTDITDKVITRYNSIQGSK
jgi:outer membrane protein